jgi:pimeloyl-ACP methyl ester carboxylesterase
MFGLCSHGRQCRCRTFRFIKLGIRKSILVGHSMGGYVAGFRRMYPEYVKAWRC